MDIFPEYDDMVLWRAVERNDHRAFSALYRRYYRDMVLFCGSYVRDRQVCEDIVQNIFIRLWNGRRVLAVRNFRMFLMKSARNACLNEMKRGGIAGSYADYISRTCSMYADIEGYILYSDLESNMMEVLSSIPPQYKEVFVENRFKGRTCKEIAESLGLSYRTVEERLRKALKIIRTRLKEYDDRTKR